MSVRAVDILEFIVNNAVSNYGVYTHQRSRKSYLADHEGREVLLYFRGKTIARLHMKDGMLLYHEAGEKSPYRQWRNERKPWRDGLDVSYLDPIEYDLADPDTPDQIDKKLKRLLRKSNFFSAKISVTFVTVLSIIAIAVVIILFSLHLS